MTKLFLEVLTTQCCETIWEKPTKTVYISSAGSHLQPKICYLVIWNIFLDFVF